MFSTFSDFDFLDFLGFCSASETISVSSFDFLARDAFGFFSTFSSVISSDITSVTEPVWFSLSDGCSSEALDFLARDALGFFIGSEFSSSVFSTTSFLDFLARDFF